MKKRLLTIILISNLAIASLAACGEKTVNSKKEAYEVSKEAFENIQNAQVLIEKYGQDIYEAWRLGIYDSDDLSITTLNEVIGLLDEELNLSAEDLQDGVVGAFAVATGDTEEEVLAAADDLDIITGAYFYMFLSQDNLFSGYVQLVNSAYEKNGTEEEIQKYLDSAKELMKRLSESYSDYEHYPSLKAYYTTMTSYFEFCQSPTGTFEQVKETINKYNNDMRDYKNDLNFIFEE